MRMWMVSPRIMCRKHLLGEHVELHMFVGHIRLRRALGRFVSNGLIETASIKKRHDALVAEMKRRGYQHRSPLRYTDRLKAGRVDRYVSLGELLKRCPQCKENYREQQ